MIHKNYCQLVYLLKLVKWELNVAKSILTPQSTITFLSAEWTKFGIKRSTKVSNYIVNLVNEKELQQVRGLLSYYCAFAGNYFGIIDRFLTSINSSILINELNAAILGNELAVTKLKQSHKNELELYVDNRTVIQFINKGRAKWSWPVNEQYQYTKTVELIRRQFSRIRVHYIHTSGNPADALSRKNLYEPYADVT